MTSHEGMPSLPQVDPVSAEHVPATSLTPELLASLLTDGDDELAAWALRHALAEQPRPAVFDGLVTRAMRIVGERWERGEWSVADEHWASQTLVRALDQVRPELGPESRVGPLAVIATVSGEFHALALVCLEQCLREAGWQVANLGADVPAEDIARFVRERAPQCVALGALDPARLPTVAGTAMAIREAAGDARVPILLGGPLAARPGAAEEAGVDWAGTTVSGALAFCATIAPEADDRA